MNKTIKIDDKDIKVKVSAGLLPLYREYFGRELFKDMTALQDINPDNMFEGNTMNILENISWTMAKHADDSIPDKNEWLEQFGLYSLIEVLPEIVGLWLDNQDSKSQLKKKNEKQ